VNRLARGIAHLRRDQLQVIEIIVEHLPPQQ
jgi:hypothetical protein